MIKDNKKLKAKIQETITNVSNLGVLPADEAQLNLDVIYNSILDEICSVVPLESPHQIISVLKLVYDSVGKSVVKTENFEKDIYRMLAMNSLGAVPVNDSGYPTDDVSCIIVPNENNIFMAPYQKIIPGTIDISDGSIIDDGTGKLVDKQGKEAGTVDYLTGKFTFTTAPASALLKYKFDIYNLMTDRNFIKFVKQSAEIFSTLFQLDLDSATVLFNMKGLDYKKNVGNIIPQVLAQQIDQYILEKYFELAESNLATMASFNAGNPDFSKTDNYSTLKLYDLGTLINLESAKFASKNGVVPNVILCNPIGYGLISTSTKFIPYNSNDEDKIGTGTPRLVGYFNNAKVFLTNNHYDYGHTCIVLTYKGPSDAQAAGVFAPFIPVSLRTVEGMEGGGMITTTNAYSMGGFSMINPDLVSGIMIDNK